MSRFSTHILPERLDAGEKLKRARLRLNYSLDQVSCELKLPIKYLAALERGAWDELPKGGYVGYYLKTYTQFLDISAEPILSNLESKSSLKLFTPSTARPLFLQIGRWRRLGFALVVCFIFSYLSWGAWRKLQPPVLTLISPVNDFSTHEPIVPVVGSTRVGTKVWINNEEVDVSDNGAFNEAVPLRVGINPITIIAKRQYRRPLVITRQIQFTAVVTTKTLDLSIP